MFGIIFIYVIGWIFYKLASKFEKKRWIYALLGISMFVFSIFVCTIFFTIINIIFNEYFNKVFGEFVSSIFIFLGTLGSFIYYLFLKKTWEIQKSNPISEINEIGNNQT